MLPVRVRDLLVFAATFAAAASVLLFSSTHFTNDDQFITYRYIDNIASGQGFVYNIGEHVLGATTPLFTLVGAALKFIFSGVPTPTIVAWANVLFLSLAALFFYRVARKFMSEPVALTAVLVFGMSLSRTISEGMESPLFILLLMAFLYALLSKRHYSASVLLALALLTRPDAGLIAILALLYWLGTVGWRESIRLVAVCIAVALPWLVFSTSYFGSFVPQSLIAKLHSKDIYNIIPLQGVKVQLASYSRIFWGRLYDPDNLILQSIFNLFPFLALVAYGMRKRLARENWIVFAIPLVYFVSYSLSNPIIFPWYVSQMEPLWILMSFIGVASVLERIHYRWFTLLVLALLIVGPFFFWAGEITSQSGNGKQGLVDAAAYLKMHIHEGDTVALSNIGIVGYMTNARIFDFIGLVTPISPSFYPLSPECRDRTQLFQISPPLVQYANADWIVGSGELTKCTTESAWFRANYTEVVPEIWKHI